MKYIVKCGELYADGGGGWVRSQKEAFVFEGWGAREWAAAHANYLGFGRVMKLVRRKK